jgi:ribulose-5-phosphate 4-epimerase/fuculose-1-phosphate aldolase
VTKTNHEHSAERQARIELAAFYRLVEYRGWGEGIYNHIALRVPAEPHLFLIKPHTLTYEEVTASNLVKVDCRQDLDERAGVNKVGFSTHAPVMRTRPDVNCSIHIHTAPIMAIAAHPVGLRMLGIHSVHFYDGIAYQDQEYGGIVESVDAQQSIVDGLGDKRVLIMRNHGALIAGSSAEDTFASLLRLHLACEVQLMLEAAGQGCREISPEACARGAEQQRRHDAGRGGADWPAWLRRMDRLDPGYKD